MKKNFVAAVTVLVFLFALTENWSDRLDVDGISVPT
jgi:hypothetical protein